MAVADFDPLFVTAGRSLLAAVFTVFSIIGYPLLMAIAMQQVGWLEVGFALLVVAIVALGWRMRVARPA